MTVPGLAVTEVDGVLTIRFDRPESFNALTGECSSDLPQAAAFVPFVVNDQRWFKDGIWNQCAGAAPCPVT